MSRTLEQHRAKYSLERIQQAQNLPESDRTKYGTLVRKLPAMILNNGLGQAMAFLLADDEGKHAKPSWHLYRGLQEWLSGDSAPMTHPSRIYVATPPNLIEQLISGSRASYLRAQQETLALLVWMKKFADAYLPKGGE